MTNFQSDLFVLAFWGEVLLDTSRERSCQRDKPRLFVVTLSATLYFDWCSASATHAPPPSPAQRQRDWCCSERVWGRMVRVCVWARACVCVCVHVRIGARQPLLSGSGYNLSSFSSSGVLSFTYITWRARVSNSVKVSSCFLSLSLSIIYWIVFFYW